jgi:hypothetical protein
MFVTALVACDLFYPIVGVRPRDSIVIRASMPKAAVNEHGDVGSGEHHIGSPAEYRNGTGADPESKAACMQK